MTRRFRSGPRVVPTRCAGRNRSSLMHLNAVSLATRCGLGTNRGPGTSVAPGVWRLGSESVGENRRILDPIVQDIKLRLVSAEGSRNLLLKSQHAQEENAEAHRGESDQVRAKFLQARAAQDNCP
jgi:hypothetical protein